MTDKKIDAIKVILGATKGKPVRFSYLNVHEARLNSESGKMERSVLTMIPKENVEDIAAVKAAIEAQKRAHWYDEKTKKLLLPPKFWNPLLDGDVDVKQNGKPFPDECKGHMLINCKTDGDNDIDIVGTTRGPDDKLVKLGVKEIKSGDWGRVSANFKGYVKGTGGVGAYLNTVQKTKNGDPLSAHSSAEDDFGQFDDEEELDPMMM